MKRRRFLSHLGMSALASTIPARAWASGGTMDATRLGVTPDLAVDQTTAFQAMLDTAAAQRKAITLPAGIYVISGVRLPSDTVLRGTGGRTQIVHAGAGPLLRAHDASAIVLTGLTFEGVGRPADTAEGLLDFRDVFALDIGQCVIRDAAANAVYLESSSGTLRGNAISGAGQFALFSIDGAGVTVEGNAISDCANGGIIVHRSVPGHDGTSVAANSITATGAANGGTGQWGNAINFFRADDVTATGNTIRNTAFSAIRGNSVRNMTVTGNSCIDCGETAIYAEFAFENAVITDNTIDGAANGISATNLDQGGHGATVTGNTVRNLRSTGPYEAEFPGFGTGISVEADAVVAGNTVDGAALYGINAGWGPYLRNVSIEANTIRDARYGIGVTVADGAGVATIRGNTISARETGIQAHEWGKPVGADLLANPAAAPANVRLSANSAASD